MHTKCFPTSPPQFQLLISADMARYAGVPFWLTAAANIIVVFEVLAWFPIFLFVMLPLDLMSCRGRIRPVARWRNALLGIFSALKVYAMHKLTVKPLQLILGYELWVILILYVVRRTTYNGTATNTNFCLRQSLSFSCCFFWDSSLGCYDLPILSAATRRLKQTIIGNKSKP